VLAFMIAMFTAGALVFAGRHIAGEQAAYSGPMAAQCVPARLNVSDVLPRTDVQVSPLPGSYDAMPETQVSFLGVPVEDILDVSVNGSFTGSHAGSLKSYSQGDGASFVPEQPFKPGETVTVSGSLRSGRGPVPFSFSFNVAYPDPIPYKTELSTPRATPPSGSVQSFHSAPELQPPTIDVTTNSAGVLPGDIFLAPYSGPGPDGPTILNQQGQLVWMDPLPGEMKATNLQVENYEGRPVLTWWQGYIPEQGFGLGEEVVADTSYRQILHVKAGNGNMADLHDFHLESNHTAVLTVFRTIHCDLSSVDGPKDAALTDSSFQEIDVTTGLVRREWTSVDHVALSESYVEPYSSSTQWPFDFFHLNTVDPRPDGTTLISGRNVSALYLLDTKTGQVIDNIGGRNSNLKMAPGARTAFQHDAMTLPSGDLSIFDNGGSPFDRSYSENESRGLIVSIGADHTDTVVEELKHTPALQARSQGDVQEVVDGSWFVGWGQEPYFSEYGSNGKLLYDAHMWAIKESKTLETQSYRTYKFAWHAMPFWPPAITARHFDRRVEVWASWNGATEVGSWRVLGGASSSDLAPLTNATSRGFETTLYAEYAPYVEVQALDRAGHVIGDSTVIRPS
jgi:hypothetical protein